MSELQNARFEDVGTEQYHDIPAISNSMIKAYSKDPEQCYRQYVKKSVERGAPSKAFQFGTRVERIVMFDEQPNAVQIPLEVMSKRKKAGKEDEFTYARAGAPYKEWEERTLAERGEDCALYTEAEMDKHINPLLAAVARLKEHKKASQLLWGRGQVHKTMLWDDVSQTVEGNQVTLPCKCQLDGLLDAGVIWDLKSVAPANSTDVYKLWSHIFEYGYNWQGWWYKRAVRAVTGKDMPFVLVFVQSEAPFRVYVQALDPQAPAELSDEPPPVDFIELAEMEIQEVMVDLSRSWVTESYRQLDQDKIVQAMPLPWMLTKVQQRIDYRVACRNAKGIVSW